MMRAWELLGKLGGNGMGNAGIQLCRSVGMSFSTASPLRIRIASISALLLVRSLLLLAP